MTTRRSRPLRWLGLLAGLSLLLAIPASAAGEGDAPTPCTSWERSLDGAAMPALAPGATLVVSFSVESGVVFEARQSPLTVEPQQARRRRFITKKRGAGKAE